MSEKLSRPRRGSVNGRRRRKFERMSLAALRTLRDDVQVVIAEIERGDRRELDIASDHTGDRSLIAEVLEVRGDKASGKWIEVRRIYCSPERCSQCPHGDYWYECRDPRATGTPMVRLVDSGFRRDAIDRIGVFRLHGNEIIVEKDARPPETPRSRGETSCRVTDGDAPLGASAPARP